MMELITKFQLQKLSHLRVIGIVIEDTDCVEFFLYFDDYSVVSFMYERRVREGEILLYWCEEEVKGRIVMGSEISLDTFDYVTFVEFFPNCKTLIFESPEDLPFYKPIPQIRHLYAYKSPKNLEEMFPNYTYSIFTEEYDPYSERPRFYFVDEIFREKRLPTIVSLYDWCVDSILKNKVPINDLPPICQRTIWQGIKGRTANDLYK